jgi:uncharacterized protein (DUF1684 family)
MRTVQMLAALLTGLALSSCTSSGTTSGTTGRNAAHADWVAETEAWHADRLAGLRSETGSLSQVGLHPLPAGSWTLGSAPDADIILHAAAPPRLGVITVTEHGIRFTAYDDVVVEIHQSTPAERVETTAMATTGPDAPTVLAVDTLLLHVIVRDGTPLLRVRDRTSSALADFEGIDRFDLDEAYRVTAKLIPDDTTTLTLRLEGGFTATAPSPGLVQFELDGTTHMLRPTVESDGWLFFVFADATTGTETYPGGRFLDAEPIGADGTIVLDFNRAYTPVCAFNAYSTCPRPPPGNTLPVAIRAGEKYDPEF